MRRTILSEEEIQTICSMIGRQLSSRYRFSDEPPVAICVMNGAIPFASDLLKNVNIPIIIDYIQLSTYRNGESNGNVIINNKAWMVSDRRIKDNGNMLNQTKHQQEEFDKKLRHFGYTLEECSKNYEARQIVNIRSMQEWCRNYKCTYQNITRGELW